MINSWLILLFEFYYCKSIFEKYFFSEFILNLDNIFFNSGREKIVLL